MLYFILSLSLVLVYCLKVVGSSIDKIEFTVLRLA